MNIGFFGDSYVDMIWHRFTNVRPLVPPDQISWCERLLKDFNAPFICSGLGGSSQYHAIAEWQHFSQKYKFDVAIFTFTWDHRLYAATKQTERILTANIEQRDIELATQLDEEIQVALNHYYSKLASRESNKFCYALMVKWILELPEQYPDTKFIFLPNTVDSQNMSKKYFDQGVLVDFAFEVLTEAEGERVGVRPFIPNRVGHLSGNTHEKVNTMIKDIIVNYDSYKNKIFLVNYDRFELKTIYTNFYPDQQ